MNYGSDTRTGNVHAGEIAGKPRFPRLFALADFLLTHYATAARADWLEHSSGKVRIDRNVR